MPSVTALNKAGQDVLRYHSRRVFVRPTMSDADKRIFCVICAMGAIGLPLFMLDLSAGLGLVILTEPDSDSLDLQRATVKAMGNIGDAKALPILEQLVGGALGAEASPNLREDARTALFELQERINPGYVGRNLLRASDAPAVSPDELLRPATTRSETPPQELLRAQNGP